MSTAPVPEPAESKEFFLTDEDELQNGPDSLGNKVWIYARGNVRLYKDAMGLLLGVHDYLTGAGSKHVDEVTAVIRDKKLYLIPGTKQGMKPTEVSWSLREARINLSSLFKRAKVDVETGYRELYPCSFEKETLYGPALVVDLAAHEKRRSVSKKNKGNQTA